MDKNFNLRSSANKIESPGNREFSITSEFTPTGDQPQAIRELGEGLRRTLESY